MRNPSRAFHRVHSIVYSPSCNKRRREEVNGGRGGGTVAHCIHIAFAVEVGINWSASTGSVSNRRESDQVEESVSIGLYLCSRLLDFSFC